MQPDYAPNTVNQTVGINGRTFRGQPGQGWTDITAESQANDAKNALATSQAKIDAQNAANRVANDTRFASNKSELGNFITSYQNAVPGIINSTSEKYQLPQLASAATNLGTRTSNIMGNLTGEGAGGYASGAQVDKAVQTNYLPRWGQAISNLNTGTQLAQTEENQLIAPYTTQATLLNDRMAREATAYTTEQQNELASLVSQLNAGVTLTTTQMNNANALAQKQLEYDQAVKTATINANKIQTTAAGSYVFDPATGQYKRLA